MAVPGIPVLIYHAIDNTDAAHSSRNVSVTLESFREQMAWLHSEGYISVSREDLHNVILHGKRLNDKYVLITFDDGYYSLVNCALPIMNQYGFKATLFLSTSFVGRAYDQDDFYFVKHDRQLTWEELKVLKDNGWSIQSHGYNHFRMNKLTDEQLKEEATVSRKIIEENLGTAVYEFAFPYGIYTAKAINTLKSAGYKFAYSVHSGKLFPYARRYRLPRIEVNNMDTMDSFRTKVRTGYTSPSNARRSKLRDIIYASASLKDLIERWTPIFGFGNH